jgi:hypothetical protein
MADKKYPMKGVKGPLTKGRSKQEDDFIDRKHQNDANTKTFEGAAARAESKGQKGAAKLLKKDAEDNKKLKGPGFKKGGRVTTKKKK